MNVKKVSAPLHSQTKTHIPSNVIISDGSLFYFPVVPFFVRKAIPLSQFFTGFKGSLYFTVISSLPLMVLKIYSISSPSQILMEQSFPHYSPA